MPKSEEIGWLSFGFCGQTSPFLFHSVHSRSSFLPLRILILTPSILTLSPPSSPTRLLSSASPLTCHVITVVPRPATLRRTLSYCGEPVSSSLPIPALWPSSPLDDKLLCPGHRPHRQSICEWRKKMKRLKYGQRKQLTKDVAGHTRSWDANNACRGSDRPQ